MLAPARIWEDIGAAYTWEPGQEDAAVRPIGGDAEAAEFRLDALLAEAEHCAEAQLLNQGLTAVMPYTRWAPRLGRKTHVSTRKAQNPALAGLSVRARRDSNSRPSVP